MKSERNRYSIFMCNKELITIETVQTNLRFIFSAGGFEKDVLTWHFLELVDKYFLEK